jgi:hypothetical protein
MEKTKSVTTPMGFCQKAPSHIVILIKKLLGKKEIPVLEYSLHHLTSSKITSLFPETKNVLKKTFYSVTWRHLKLCHNFKRFCIQNRTIFSSSNNCSHVHADGECWGENIKPALNLLHSVTKQGLNHQLSQCLQLPSKLLPQQFVCYLLLFIHSSVTELQTSSQHNWMN